MAHKIPQAEKIPEAGKGVAVLPEHVVRAGLEVIREE